MKRHVTLCFCLGFFCLSFAAEKPNIVVILADDLGYGDVGFHGSDIRTPHLDSLAREGVRLEQFYVAPMCSPTRAGLMTGRYPLRFGMMRSVIPPQRNYGLDTEEDMLPEMLARAGYAYRGCFGKWHLGHAQNKWRPTARGFTHFVGCLNGAIDYFSHEREGELDWHRNDEPNRDEGYATDLIAEAAVSFIEEVPRDEPYFLYVPFNAPHSPFQAKEEDIAKYPNRKGKSQVFAAMVDSMDQGIGQILSAIDERGDADNTFVLFFSDNGGVNKVGANGEQRGSKLTVYQGGIRVAAAVRWPKGGLVGGGVKNDRMGYIDVMPTLKGIAGLDESAVKPFDGIDVLGTLKKKGGLPDRPWFTYMDQGKDKRERLAVNYDTRKLVAHRPAPDGDPQGVEEVELFAIEDDSLESKDLSDSSAEVTERLMGEVDSFLELKSKEQIIRFNIGKQEFVAPKDWQVED